MGSGPALHIRGMSETLTRTEYLRLAARFEDLAKTSTNPVEVNEYRARAAMFNRLAAGRLTATVPDHNFVKRGAGRRRKSPSAE
jgi:hypothetical protein